MKIRILIFEDETSIRRPLSTFLQSKGYEVLAFPSPISCALFSRNLCICPRDHACADMVITDMQMPEMNGLELIRTMAVKGCCVPPRNKIVISSAVTPEQKAELVALGCIFLPKPFELGDLLAIIRDCEKNIPTERKLITIEELETCQE